MIGSETDSECLARLLRLQSSFDRLKRIPAFKRYIDTLRTRFKFNPAVYNTLKDEQRKIYANLKKRGLWDKIWDGYGKTGKQSKSLIFGLGSVSYQHDKSVRRHFELNWEVSSMERLIPKRAIGKLSLKWHIRQEDAKGLVLSGEPFLFFKRRKKYSQKSPKRPWFIERNSAALNRDVMIVRLWEDSKRQLSPNKIAQQLSCKDIDMTANGVSQVLSRYRKIMLFKPKEV